MMEEIRADNLEKVTNNIEGEINSLEVFGLYLQQYRQRMGLSVIELARKTKIPPEQVDALESGKITSLPQVIAKGFVRIYATEVGLNPDNMVLQYQNFLDKPQTNLNLKPSFKRSRENAPTFQKFFYIVLLVVLIFLIVVGFYAAPYLSEKILPKDDGILGEINPSVVTANVLTNNSNQNDENITEYEELLVVPTNLEQNLPKPLQLKLIFLKDSWAQVNVDGGPVEHIKLGGAQEKSWQAKEKIEVIVGDVKAIKALVNGQEKKYKQKTGKVGKFIIEN